MVKREIRYITLYDGEYDKQIFAFEVGIDLMNEDGKVVRDHLFSILKSELPDFSDRDIETAINDYAYKGIADLAGYVISSDDIICYTFD